MVSNKIEYFFITSDSFYYNDIVKLRYEVFYRPSRTGIDAVFDNLEDNSYHLVATLNDRAVGYLRLTVDGDKGQLSQFVVEQSMKGKLGIAKGLFDRMIKKAEENSVHELWGEIRLHVAQVAKRFGFDVSEEIFPSKKTGIPHRMMKKNIWVLILVGACCIIK